MEIVELPHEDRRCADVITVEDARLEVTASALDRRLFGNHHLSPQNSRSLFLLYSGLFESHGDKSDQSLCARLCRECAGQAPPR
jgi:hypothetical protein